MNEINLFSRSIYVFPSLYTEQQDGQHVPAQSACKVGATLASPSLTAPPAEDRTLCPVLSHGSHPAHAVVHTGGPLARLRLDRRRQPQQHCWQLLRCQ